MDYLKSIGLIFNFKTLIVAILSVLSTYLSMYYEFYADFPLTLIGIAVVFPIVFSINSAYKRREIALEHYASFKAHGRALYMAVRDWVPKSTKRFQNRFKRMLYEVLYDSRVMFNTDHKDDEYRETMIYHKFSKISKLIEKCRTKGLSPGEVSRCNQYLSKMLIAFENMKHIYQYRTPITLRAYSKIFNFLLPILYGPYFAKLALNIPYFLVFLIPILLTVILVSLDNIQDQLENPFDLIGEDDIHIHAEKYMKELDV